MSDDDVTLPTRAHAPPGMAKRADGGYNFAPGTELWKKRLTYGIGERLFETAEALLEEVVGYFQWLTENPLMEAKLVSYEGTSSIEEVPKIRAGTLQGLCLFVGINRDTWGRWRRGDRPDLLGVITFAENYMYNHKFEGAAAGLLNANIIARDIGLAERHEVTGRDGGPLTTITAEMTPQEAADAYRRTLGGDE